VLIDLGFAALLNGTVGVVIAAADGPWWLVLSSALLDFGEGLAMWVILRRPTPTAAALHLLFGLAFAKFIAYGASWIALARAMLELF